MRAVALLLLALAPLALAQEAPAEPATFLVYRPWPDRAPGDPLASALAPHPFDAPRLPATFVDRATRAATAPENAPESAPAHYREMLRLVQAAEVEGTTVALRVDGTVAPGTLTVRVEARPLPERPPAAIDLELVVFEHGVVVAGRAEPYVARFSLAPENVTLPGNATQQVRLDAAWDVDRLGVVAIARAEGRVLQSAAWLPRQDAPTEQAQKAALVEHVTASWCEACRAADDAFLLLATQRGPAGALPAAGDASYLRPATPWLWGGLALGLAGAIVAARGRRA